MGGVLDGVFVGGDEVFTDGDSFVEPEVTVCCVCAVGPVEVVKVAFEVGYDGFLVVFEFHMCAPQSFVMSRGIFLKVMLYLLSSSGLKRQVSA